MKGREPDSIDLLCTDPPYGISFMGKDWDRAVPSVDVWKECLRLLKPGAFAFVMSLPRFDVLSQMGVRLQEAGFRVDFTPLFWAFASGFPKATNISKAVDKKLGNEREYVDGGQGRTNSILSKREPNRALSSEPINLYAHALEGSYAGFQPKPALEVIIVAMKPLSEKTYVEQALKNQKGVTWLDDARIPFQNEDDLEERKRGVLKSPPMGRHGIYGAMNEIDTDANISENGRFPANLLVSDDALNDGTISKGGEERFNEKARGFDKGKFMGQQGLGERSYYGAIDNYGDSGSFSRFFSLDAWWNDKIKELPEAVRKTFPFLIEPKASKDERNEGLEGEPTFRPTLSGGEMEGGRTATRTGTTTKNHHPTVKPLAIMSYLITLGSRRGDVVLDPFAGSGTTIMAAKMLGRDGIGIEINPEYAKITEARLTAISSLEEWLQ